MRSELLKLRDRSSREEGDIMMSEAMMALARRRVKDVQKADPTQTEAQAFAAWLNTEAGQNWYAAYSRTRPLTVKEYLRTDDVRQKVKAEALNEAPVNDAADKLADDLGM